VALEFSQVYARAGAKVTILEALPRLLLSMDHEEYAPKANGSQSPFTPMSV
jgi:pyruvate/2-oxoglutarate dehydrogenase complex dihydrolipoamide dehydrogenase (E3) component